MKEKLNDKIFNLLLEDKNFLEWIINPTPELDFYWEEKAKSDRKIGENINILKSILENLKVNEPELSSGQRQEIWSKIEEETIKKNSRLKSSRRIWLKAASVAAVFALIAVNLWFFMPSDHKGEDIDYISLMNNNLNDLDLTTGDVTLVLPDNKLVNMKSDSAEVIYDTDGRVKVNSQEINTDEENNSNINQLFVPYGKTTFLTLSDGTKVWINAGSKILYPSVFEGKKREIYLTGEAYFDVAKHEKQPFIIKTNELDVRVLGTKLNITAYDNENEQTVVLVSGKVDVNSKNDKTSYNMVPNQLFSYDLRSKETDLKNVDVTGYISWVNGYLLLQSESLDKLLGRIDRHYNTSTNFNKEEFRKVTVSGKLDMRKDLDKILEYISTTTPITYRIDGREISVSLIK